MKTIMTTVEPKTFLDIFRVRRVLKNLSASQEAIFSYNYGLVPFTKRRFNLYGQYLIFAPEENIDTVFIFINNFTTGKYE